MARARGTKRASPRAVAPSPSAPSPSGVSAPGEAPPRAAGGFVAGGLLLAAGAGLLLYPIFQRNVAFRELVSRFEHLPLLAVLLAGAGIATLVRAVSRAGIAEPHFALDVGGPFLAKVKRELNPWRFFVLTWQELDREAAEERAARAAAGLGGYDWRPLVAFASGAVFLGLMEYYGHHPHMVELLADLHAPHDGPPDHWVDEVRAAAFYTPRGRATGLVGFAWWSLWRVLGFFVFPALVIRLVLRERVVDYGLQTKGFLEHAWIYGLFFAIVLVLVVVVSYEESFQTYYPFYRAASRSWYDFWTWELLYAAQFFSLEFFFRGFWLKAAKRAMGSHAIYAMTVPYVMIHFGKPFPETLAAILAGIALGTLALRTRSIWSGFLIHVSVALSMDIAALLQTDGLPERWWPAL